MKKIASICMAVMVCTAILMGCAQQEQPQTGPSASITPAESVAMAESTPPAETVQPTPAPTPSSAPTVNYLVWTGEQWNNAPQEEKRAAAAAVLAEISGKDGVDSTENEGIDSMIASIDTYMQTKPEDTLQQIADQSKEKIENQAE